jgi:hypothetical protein
MGSKILTTCGAIIAIARFTLHSGLSTIPHTPKLRASKGLRAFVRCSWKENLTTAANGSTIRQVNLNELTPPVSLLWRSDGVIDDVPSRSKLPLNPSQKGKRFVWNASGLSPLVVWDP